LQDVADACRTGPATDIIFGLALGYKSCIIPTFVMAIAIYIANSLAGMLGIACAALGMLATLSTGLAIDAYGPISDNAGGIAEMAGMGECCNIRSFPLPCAQHVVLCSSSACCARQQMTATAKLQLSMVCALPVSFKSLHSVTRLRN
jgi:hypothetical protein